MGKICKKRKEFKNKLFSIFVFLFCICLVIIFVVCQAYYHSKDKREKTGYIIDLYSARMEQLINKLIDKTNVLETFIVSNEGNISEETFNDIASSLLDEPGITSIEYLPNGVVTYCYPLEGNEEAIGNNILKNSTRKEDALYAKKTKETFISGPYEFYQGGSGLTILNPIYLSNHGEDKFLGFVVFTLKLPDLFDTLHFEGIERNGYYYRLYYTSMDNAKDITIIKESDTKVKNPMMTPISDIANRTWILELSPTNGWIDWNTNITILILGLFFSILLTKIYIRREQNKWLLHQLEIEKKVLRLSLEQSDLNVFLYDPITKILEFKSQGYSVRKLDYQVKNVPESLIDSLVLPEFEKEFLGMYQAISDGVEKASCVVKVCIEGKYLWERITLVNVPLAEKGSKNQVIGMVENITTEKENEYKLENERQYREAMIAKSLAWIEADLTNNRMISVDGEAIETSEDYETFFEKLVHDRVYIDDVPHILSMCSIEHLYTSYYQNGISNFQVEYRRWVNGNWIWSLSSVYLTLDTEIGALKMMLVSHDNNARKMEEIKLTYRAE